MTVIGLGSPCQNRYKDKKFMYTGNMNLKNQAGFSVGGFIVEFVQSIVLALSLFVLIYIGVAQPNEVKGSSMVPNFETGQYLLTDKISYRLGEPKRGQVIVFKAPASEPCAADSCEYIKRIIGVAGDKVMVSEGRVYLNGQMLDQTFLPAGLTTAPGAYLREGQEIVVPEGMVLPLGDNRSGSRDGREFGPITKDLIVGKAFFRYWPPKAVGLIPKVEF